MLTDSGQRRNPKTSIAFLQGDVIGDNRQRAVTGLRTSPLATRLLIHEAVTGAGQPVPPRLDRPDWSVRLQAESAPPMAATQ